MMTIKEFKEWFDRQFFALLEEKITNSVSKDGFPPVTTILSYITAYAQGGKRLRPYLAYVGYVTEGGEEEVFPLYAAIELLHLFCLVHDDIMDHELMRHGIATVHKYFENAYHDSEMGRAIALLVGDILLAWSFDYLKEVEAIEPYTVEDASGQFRTTVSEVIYGQLYDIVLQKESSASKTIIEKSIELKSARYSFFQPLYIGMLLAGADESQQSFVEEYAVNLGMAFQIQDDIADYPDDIAVNQQTIISWFMRHQADEEDKQLFEQYAGKEWSEQDEKKLTRLLEDSGALPYAKNQVEEYFLAAEDAIFNHNKTGEEIWQEIIAEVRNMP
jgi:geranylgeranyl pyrophosphate synthase